MCANKYALYGQINDICNYRSMKSVQKTQFLILQVFCDFIKYTEKGRIPSNCL